ncbi:MAG: helix-turn-helix domain-containing protein [Mucilaginibacter sp.]|uniref:helix-turn-helix domain-containing protein n=1 Tax=Mucilaginibacter sp. TaxID=1882438 RepID=UPI0031AFD320
MPLNYSVRSFSALCFVCHYHSLAYGNEKYPFAHTFASYPVLLVQVLSNVLTKEAIMQASELITKGDLNEFKSELLTEIRKLVQLDDQGQSKKWLKSNEVRKLLKISPGTLQNLRINGTLTFTRIGSIMYYKLEDINKLLEGGLK